MGSTTISQAVSDVLHADRWMQTDGHDETTIGYFETFTLNASKSTSYD
jgi:hypothetical protein